MLVPSPLYAIVDVDAAAAQRLDPAGLAIAFADAGVRLLQIRAKRMAGAPLLALCEAVVDATRGAGALVIVNDRADIARLAGAAGVHVGQEDLTVDEVRRILGPGAIVGVSTHTADQIEAAQLTSADYFAVGPVFGTKTKETGHGSVGLELVARAAARSGGRPVVGIGGITIETAATVIRAGASAVAVIGDLLGSGDPVARARMYLDVLGGVGGLTGRSAPRDRV